MDSPWLWFSVCREKVTPAAPPLPFPCDSYFLITFVLFFILSWCSIFAYYDRKLDYEEAFIFESCKFYLYYLIKSICLSVYLPALSKGLLQFRSSCLLARLYITSFWSLLRLRDLIRVYILGFSFPTLFQKTSRGYEMSLYVFPFLSQYLNYYPFSMLTVTQIKCYKFVDLPVCNFWCYIIN